MKIPYLLILIPFLISACQTTNEGAESFPVKQLEPVKVYSPTDSDAAAQFYNKGVELQSAKDYQKAIEAYLRAIEFDDQYTDAMDNVGVCYRNIGDYASAKKYYEMSLKILPDNDVALINLALVYRLTNENEKALNLYSRLIEFDQDNPEGYYGLGSVYQDTGDYMKSIAFLDKSIEKYAAIDSPYIYDAYAAQGNNYLRLEDWEKALFYLEKVQVEYPENERLNQIIDDLRKKI